MDGSSQLGLGILGVYREIVYTFVFFDVVDTPWEVTSLIDDCLKREILRLTSLNLDNLDFYSLVIIPVQFFGTYTPDTVIVFCCIVRHFEKNLYRHSCVNHTFSPYIAERQAVRRGSHYRQHIQQHA